MSSPRVTVAVVSWNTRDALRRCLRSLEADRAAGLAEVRVVDNDSDDGSAEMVAGEFPAVRLHRSEVNLGFGRAVNLAAAAGHSDWIVAANADTAARPGALAALIAAGESDRRCAAAVPRLLDAAGGTQHSVHRFPSIPLALALFSGVGRLLPGLGDRLCLEGDWDPERPREVPWAHGAFMLLRREAFDSVGGFDPAQWLYAEDLDLCWRLRRAGWRTRYEPGARVDHVGGAATGQAFGAGREARHLAAAYAWMRRRRGRARTVAFAVTNVGGSILRWLIALPAGRLREGAVRQRAARWRDYARLHAEALRAVGDGDPG